MSWGSARGSFGAGETSWQLLGKEAFPGKGRTRDQELTALKRELVQVKKERDFLRGAVTYFAKQPK